MTENAISPDYGARDEPIRCLTYSPVRRLPGLPQELFATYWRDVHGPVCARLPGLGFYVQHHFSRAFSANLWPLAPGVLLMDLVLDGAVEIGFPNASDQHDFAVASPVLFGDEFNLFEHDVAYSLPHGSRTLVDRQADGISNGPDQLHRLHLYLHGEPGEKFRTWVAGFAAQLASASAVQKLRLHQPEPYRNENPQPPSPGVDHHLSDEREDIAIIEIGFESPLAARVFFESDAYQATVPEQSGHLRAIAAFLVTGVYTFIRDGIITTAGLRGSRPAELIKQIGAANQTQPEVTRLFAPQAR